MYTSRTLVPRFTVIRTLSPIWRSSKAAIRSSTLLSVCTHLRQTLANSPNSPNSTYIYIYGQITTATVHVNINKCNEVCDQVSSSVQTWHMMRIRVFLFCRGGYNTIPFFSSSSLYSRKPLDWCYVHLIELLLNQLP
jgi:hypothetical protein